MITLFTFGPAFGLPDPSPFVMKAEMLLKLSGLPYETDTNGFNKAPKGKMPYIRDGEAVVGDSSFIRAHLEAKHGIEFDKGLDPVDKAIAHAFEKLCEDNLYWVIVHERWGDDENFNNGPRKFFDAIPAPVRLAMVPIIRRKVARDVKGQGTSRHTQEEIAQIGAQGLAALSDFLADKPYFMGDAPTGTDATVFGCVASALCSHFTLSTRAAYDTHPNLAAYRDRMMAEFYPELAKKTA